MKANVALSIPGLLGIHQGSGVVVQMDIARAVILTNRHVVEPAMESESTLPSGPIQLLFWDGTQRVRQAVWIGPDEIDLALVTCADPPDSAIVAQVDPQRPIALGADVFTVGNPHDLSWTYSTGVISAMRPQYTGATTIMLIQTQTPLNPGNSGGGLYDTEGFLLGIATLAGDKSVSEGIGFAISIRTIVRAFAATQWDDLFAEREP